VFLGIPILWEYFGRGRSFAAACKAAQAGQQRPSSDFVIATLTATVGLIWLTFFSGIKRVKRGDKVAVSWMRRGWRWDFRYRTSFGLLSARRNS
jgi:hypothetical protein